MRKSSQHKELSKYRYIKSTGREASCHHGYHGFPGAWRAASSQHPPMPTPFPTIAPREKSGHSEVFIPL